MYQLNWKNTFFLFLILCLLLTGCDEKAYVEYSNPKNGEDVNATEPKDLVQAFYTWYLDQFILDSEVFRSPLADHVYRDSEYLSLNLIKKVDESLNGFSTLGYDPFLCAQDVPAEFYIDGVLVRQDIAYVVIHTNLPQHYFSLDLKSIDSRWFIDEISCAWTPEGVTKAFFIWYQANAVNPATGQTQNLLEDENLYPMLFLTTSFIERVEKMSKSDLVLPVQNIPQSFKVSPGRSRDIVIVHLVFVPAVSERDLLVKLEQVGSRWMIDDISFTTK